MNIKQKVEKIISIAMEDAFNLGQAYERGDVEEPRLEVRFHADKIDLLYRKEIEKEIKELLTGLLIEIGMMEDRATDSELKSGYYLSALGRIEKFILKQSLSHKKETKK